MMQTLIKNAKIYVGSGTEAFMGDILISGEKIEKVGGTKDPMPYGV